MPSSYSTSLRLELQFTGENVNTWGVRLNTDLSLLDKAICGIVTIALTGDHTLTTANAAEDQARYAVLKFTGAVAATITIPSVQKVYRVWNAGSAALIFTTGAGATVTVDPNDIVSLICDGTNVKAPGFNSLSLKDYISSVVVGGGTSLPSVVGHSGKWLTNNGSTPSWGYPTTSDITDYATDQATRKATVLAEATASAQALAVAMALTL